MRQPSWRNWDTKSITFLVHLAAHPETRDWVKKLVIWGGNASVNKEDCEAWESLRSVDKVDPVYAKTRLKFMVAWAISKPSTRKPPTDGLVTSRILKVLATWL